MKNSQAEKPRFTTYGEFSGDHYTDPNFGYLDRLQELDTKFGEVYDALNDHEHAVVIRDIKLNE